MLQIRKNTIDKLGIIFHVPLKTNIVTHKNSVAVRDSSSTQSQHIVPLKNKEHYLSVMLKTHLNPSALRAAKTLLSFGPSECSRVNWSSAVSCTFNETNKHCRN